MQLFKTRLKSKCYDSYEILPIKTETMEAEVAAEAEVITAIAAETQGKATRTGTETVVRQTTQVSSGELLTYTVTCTERVTIFLRTAPRKLQGTKI